MDVKLYKDCGNFSSKHIILIKNKLLVMAEISEDELEEMLERKPSVREAKVDDHALMVKALEHPLRRTIIKSIGVFGKKWDELKKEAGIDEPILKFQVDFLLKGEYIKIESDNYRLTDRGIVLLSNIRK